MLHSRRYVTVNLFLLNANDKNSKATCCLNLSTTLYTIVFSLTETVKRLEERCEELQELQENTSKEERERSRMREKRIRSVPSLLKMDNNEHNCQNGYDYLGFPSIFGSSSMMPKQLFIRDPVSSEIQGL